MSNIGRNVIKRVLKSYGIEVDLDASMDSDLSDQMRSCDLEYNEKVDMLMAYFPEIANLKPVAMIDNLLKDLFSSNSNLSSSSSSSSSNSSSRSSSSSNNNKNCTNSDSNESPRNKTSTIKSPKKQVNNDISRIAVTSTNRTVFNSVDWNDDHLDEQQREYIADVFSSSIKESAAHARSSTSSSSDKVDKVAFDKCIDDMTAIFPNASIETLANLFQKVALAYHADQTQQDDSAQVVEHSSGSRSNCNSNNNIGSDGKNNRTILPVGSSSLRKKLSNSDLSSSDISNNFESSSDTSRDVAYTAQENKDVDDLLQIVPDLPRNVVHYVLSHLYHNKKTQAGEFLVNSCVIAEDSASAIKALVDEFHAYTEETKSQLKKDIERDRLVREKLIEKYSLQEVKNDSGSKKGKAPLPPEMVMADSGNSKIRFRDGEIVSYKGEKVVVIRDPIEEYDGGSRGRVKSKGKRGPGVGKGL